MNKTIRRTDSTARVQITDTVVATIYEIGKGHITAALVTAAINSQLRECEQKTEQQVSRAMSEVYRLGYLKLQSLGHGAYWY